MNTQELRALQEAYMEVYEESGNIKDRDEKSSKQKADNRMVGAKQLAAYQSGMGAISKDEKEQRLNTLKKTIDKGMEKRKEKVGNRNLTFSRTKGDDALKIGKSPRNQKEETDLYDIILSHLLDEGYAETPEAAEAIMVNMSEDWRVDIVEAETGRGPRLIDAYDKPPYSDDVKDAPKYNPIRKGPKRKGVVKK